MTIPVEQNAANPVKKNAASKFKAEKIAVSPVEAAQMLDVHVSTIYKLHARGELTIRKVGRCSKIPISSVRAMVEGAA